MFDCIFFFNLLKECVRLKHIDQKKFRFMNLVFVCNVIQMIYCNTDDIL